MIAVIADDLTGAAELAAVGWRLGLSAEVRLCGAEVEQLRQIGKLLPQSQAERSRREGRAVRRRWPDAPSPDLICVDTDSRMCSPTEAGRRVAVVTRALLAAGVGWLYKKVDSVLRGNVRVELAAMLRETGAPTALLVPANPSLGRVIRGGHYFVHERPLHETEFARDPTHPRGSSSVVELLEAGGQVRVQSRRVGATPNGPGIVVGDAASELDLATWAAQRREGVMFAGGVEFFQALLRARGAIARPRSTRGPRPPGTGNTLFVCGSTSDACRQFVARARALRVPVLGFPKKLTRAKTFPRAEMQAIAQGAIAALTAEHRAILTVGLPVVAKGAQARLFGRYLVSMASTVLRQTPVDCVFVEGGATAVALARAMGWIRLRVVQELALGVAVMTVGERRPLFIMKPGSYTWPVAVRAGG